MTKPTCAEVNALYEKIVENRYDFIAEYDFWKLTKFPDDKKRAMDFVSEGNRLMALYNEKVRPWTWTRAFSHRMRRFEADVLHDIYLDIAYRIRVGAGTGIIENSQFLTEDKMKDAISVRPDSGVIGLRLRGISIAELPAKVAELANLETLALDNSPILFLPDLTRLQKLKYLRLQKTFIAGTGSFDKIQSLKNIDLRDSGVQDISRLADLPELEYLDIGGCNITTPKTSEPFKKLIRKLGKNFIYD